jgi:hypothetical protein
MPSFWLEYLQDGQRREFSFDSPSVSIGRDKGSDFVLDHPTVSRQHAIIVSNQNGHQLVVLSRGGLTAIDGSQVSGEIELFDGSQIHFGQLAFTFRSQNAPRRPANGGQQGGWGQQSQGWQGAASGGQSGSVATQSSGQWDQPGVGQQQSGAQWAPQQSGGQQGGPQSGSWAQQQSGAQQGLQSGSWAEQQSGAQQAQRQSGQFGAPGTGNFGQPTNTGNFGQPNSSGSFGGGWQDKVGADDGDDWGATADPGLMSWDEIAASADADSEVEVDAASAALTDFERIQEAQEKAAKQSKGNPVLMGGGLVAIVALMAFIMWPASKDSNDGPAQIQVANDPPKISWKKDDIDCVGEANCKAQALQAYKVGIDVCEQLDSAVENRYVCFMQLTKAEELLAKGGIEETPKEMKGYKETRDKISKLLKQRFQQLRANIYSDRKLKMWGNVAEKLRQVQATFPDPRCNYHQWALERERKMKEEGNYPAQQDYVPQ